MRPRRKASLLKKTDEIAGGCLAHPERVAVIFVLSVLDKSVVRDDYDGYSISASFQKQKDLEDYIFAVRQHGFYVQSFISEREFFAWVLGGGFEKLPQPHKFVYTSAVNGTGPGRRALVPAFCAHMGIPTLNQNPYSSTIGRHKHNTAHLLSSLGIPTAKSWLIDRSGEWLGNRRPAKGTRVIAKATYEGSSIGLGVDAVTNYSTDADAAFVDLAHRLRQPISVQEFLGGSEYEVPVFQCDGILEAWPQTLVDDDGPIGGERFLSYEKVWAENYGYGQSSSMVTEDRRTLCDVALSAYLALGYCGVARIDVRFDEDLHAKVFDVSGTPDLTTMSSCACAIREMGGEYSDLWLFSIASAMVRYAA